MSPLADGAASGIVSAIVVPFLVAAFGAVAAFGSVFVAQVFWWRGLLGLGGVGPCVYLLVAVRGGVVGGLGAPVRTACAFAFVGLVGKGFGGAGCFRSGGIVSGGVL